MVKQILSGAQRTQSIPTSSSLGSLDPVTSWIIIIYPGFPKRTIFKRVARRAPMGSAALPSVSYSEVA